MNILPKKSWHVRNKDNIERVRRDEAQAAAEEKERQRRIALAESEARLDKLRGKAPKRVAETEPDETGKEVAITDKGGHLNLFVGEEKGIKEKQANEEHAAEAKAAQEKWEKSVGILTYLGQSSTEALADKPWYFKPPSKKSKFDAEETKLASASSSRLKDEYDRKTKSSLDPMNQMGKYLDIKKKQNEEKTDDRHKKHKNKKHKHKHDHKDERESKSSSGQKSIQELRAERERREREERQKAQRLIAKHRGEKVQEQTVETDERKMKFNSQFNPEYVRTYKPKHRDYL